jgi:hypothetical protein
MAQMKWTYVADSGQQYRVVLYHGSRSGHVLVTVNQKVSIVDFYVRNTKSYQILLEDELFLLELEKGPKGFGYAFAIDKQADTDRNKARRKQKNRSIVWIVLGALVFFGIAGSIAAALMSWQERLTLRKNMPLLDEIGEITYGRVAREEDGNWTLYFTEGPMIYPLELDSTSVKIAGLRSGDDQGVLYLKGNPKVNRVAWDHSGPLRAARLLDAWMQKWPLDDAVRKACLLRALKGNLELLTHPEAPWLHAHGGRFSDWISNQNISVRARLEAECGSIEELE